MPPIPDTTVVKMMGPISILMSLMKASPNGFSDAPNSGWKCPTAIPTTMATSTWRYRREAMAFMQDDSVKQRDDGRDGDFRGRDQHRKGAGGKVLVDLES